MASARSYGKYYWSRVQRILLSGYLTQWAMLIATAINQPTPWPYLPASGGEALAHILVPTGLLAYTIKALFLAPWWMNRCNVLLVGPQYNGFLWFLGHLLLFYAFYPLIARGLRMLERLGGSYGLLGLLFLTYPIIGLLLPYWQHILGDDLDVYLYNYAIVFCNGSAICALVLRHEMIAMRSPDKKVISKRASDRKTWSSATCSAALVATLHPS